MPSLMRNSFFNMLYQLVLLLVPLASAMYVSRVVMPEGLGEIELVKIPALSTVLLRGLFV